MEGKMDFIRKLPHVSCTKVCKPYAENRRIMSFILFFCFGLFTAGNVFAQQSTVSGVVKDDSGETVIGASVAVKGTTIGTVTDVNGNYSLSNVSTGSIIVFSFIGYETQEVTYTGEQSINVTLIEINQRLNEVVVIGYGVVKKK
jgi:hypothetical protein